MPIISDFAPIGLKEMDDVKKQNGLWDEEKLNSVVKKISKIELSCKKNHEIAISIMLDFLSGVCEEANNFSWLHLLIDQVDPGFCT